MRSLKNRVLSLAVILCGTASAQNPYRVEHFLNDDPGYGLGPKITDIHVGGNELTFDLSEAPWGAHVLYVRVQDTKGRWSTTMSRPLLIERFQDIVYVEYFFDTDPGIGKGTAVQLPDQSYKAHLLLNLELDITGLSLGEHELFVRARDRFDQWTDIMSRRFTIVQGGVTPPDPPLPAGDLSMIEYFFDTDPGYGLGRKLENPRTGKNTYLMDFSGISDGAHLLCLRAKDTNGHWSTMLSRPVYIYRPTGKVEALEYYFDDNDPGEGKATPVLLPQNLSEPFAFEVSADGLQSGQHQFCVRARGDDGKWSVVYKEPFRVVTGEDSSVKSVERVLPVSMRASKRECVLTAPNGLQGDCHVEIVSVGGNSIASGEWPAGQMSFTIPLTAAEGTVVIVTVSDVKNQLHVVRRIVVR